MEYEGIVGTVRMVGHTEMGRFIDIKDVRPGSYATLTYPIAEDDQYAPGDKVNVIVRKIPA